MIIIMLRKIEKESSFNLCGVSQTDHLIEELEDTREQYETIFSEFDNHY